MALQFEGPEKKLEIILSRSPAGLRSNADGKWRAVVKVCGAEIISTRNTLEMDAYLLSESSLFVWNNRILMITCGRTTLIRSVPLIIELARPENITFCFYERKNLMYPELQSTDFRSDADKLSKFFTGKSYRLGPADDDHVHIFYACRPEHSIKDDVTLEILMHDLHPDVSAAFIPGAGETVTALERRTGIDEIYPEMESDSYLFQPYGYSLNKIADGCYATIHVTPEKSGSYASFETNLPESDYRGIISRVLEIFRPGRFSLLITESDREAEPGGRNRQPERITGFRRTETDFYVFDCGFNVSFSNYIADSLSA